MAEPKPFPVFDSKGRVGTLYATARFLDDRAERVIRLETGQEIRVPADALQISADGSFLLRSPVAEYLNTAPKPTPANPMPATQVPAGQPPTAHQESKPPEAVESRKTIAAQLPDDPLFRTAYNIERVTIDRLLDEPAVQRQEGDTMILPVMEEVLVFEKKLMLREEIRITPKKERIADPRAIEIPKH